MLRLTKPYFNGAEQEAVKEVFESGWLAEGPKTAKFEQLLAKEVGAKYAVAVCNATVGIELCLRALNVIGNVYTAAFGHIATPIAIKNAGCTPKFLDVNLSSYLVNTNTIVMGGHFGVPVSWGGNALTLDVGYVEDNKMVEDAACSLGATLQLNFPRVYSFHPRKIITTGEGGAVTTNDKKLAETLRELKNFGRGNYKFDDIKAAIGIEQLKKLNYIIKMRQQMARIYDELLKDLPVAPPQTHYHNSHTYQTYAVLLKRGNRNKIINILKAKGIETQIGAYCLDEKCKNAKILADNLLSLPMAYDISFDQQKQVVDELKSAVSKTSHH
jgi:dTDP-4-amino-4,6-dideoxygalactose transaminase